MLKVLLACAVGAGTAEGEQPEPGEVPMAVSGPGEALAAGDDPVPFGFAVLPHPSPTGSIPSPASRGGLPPTCLILQGWPDPWHVGWSAGCLKWKKSWKMLRTSPRGAPCTLLAASEVRARSFMMSDTHSVVVVEKTQSPSLCTCQD